jgi:hypothetical protein
MFRWEICVTGDNGKVRRFLCELRKATLEKKKLSYISPENFLYL